MSAVTKETPVNLDGIAERLNLSKATVSRALRNLPGTHPRTRSRVMEAAAEMGYRSLRTRSADVVDPTTHRYIGVFVRSSRGRWRSTPFLEGLSQAANSLDVSLVLQHVPFDEAEILLKAQEQPPAMREGSLAGVVLLHRWPKSVVSYLAARYACVSIVHDVPDIHLDLVDMNHESAMHQMMSHLVAQGHQKIGFVGRSRDFAWSKARCGGYNKALYELNLPTNPAWIIDVPAPVLEDFNDEWDAVADKVAAQICQGVRAWMACSDWAGYALSRKLLERGFCIPDDVSITGFDNIEHETYGCPPLTSVAVPHQAMGAEALRNVLRRTDEPALPRHTSLLDCALVVGKSTAVL